MDKSEIEENIFHEKSYILQDESYLWVIFNFMLHL